MIEGGEGKSCTNARLEHYWRAEEYSGNYGTIIYEEGKEIDIKSIGEEDGGEGEEGRGEMDKEKQGKTP
jgi:hypothetical protein